MAIQLNNHQQKIYNVIEQAVKSPISSIGCPIGCGRILILCKVISDHNGPCCAIAHHQDMIIQISLMLARNGIRHRIVAPESVIRGIIKLHANSFGKSFHDDQSDIGVAGVYTLVKRRVEPELSNWLNTLNLQVYDGGTQWGEVERMSPKAKVVKLISN